MPVIFTADGEGLRPATLCRALSLAMRLRGQKGGPSAHPL